MADSMVATATNAKASTHPGAKNVPNLQVVAFSRYPSHPPMQNHDAFFAGPAASFHSAFFWRDHHPPLPGENKRPG